MTDLTPEALDVLVARYKQVASTMRKMKAASIEAHEIDAGADTITALRAQLSEVEAERDAAIAAMSEAARKR